MKRVESLFIKNPLVYSDLKKYIWFKNDTQQKAGAVSIFWEFIVKEEVYIEGFATDEAEYIGEKAFNKPIVDIGTLNPGESIVFIEEEYEEKLYDICKPVTIVNPDVDGKKIVIFGAGKYGEKVYRQLERRGMGERVYCFIDSDEAKCGERKEGLDVCNVNILLEASEDLRIIEASQVHEEMEELLQKKGIVQKRFFYVDEHKERMKLSDQYYDGIKFRINCLDELCSRLSAKKFYYYGKRDDSAEKTGRCLRLLDFHFNGFLHDRVEDIKEGDHIVEDILYDEDIFILVDKFHSQKQREKLQNLGLRLGKDYNVLDMNCYHKNMDNLMLDLNLGYTYKEGDKYSGFAIYGEENEDDYKIVTLGGSTTDSNINWEKSWPLYLYEKLSLERRVTVYNGGIAGYNSGQELIKLIRDVLPLKPDLIVSYGGISDLIVTNAERPFAFPYLQKIFKYAGENMDSLQKDIQMDMGIKSEKTVFENWISNIEIMHSIAELWGIQFLYFVSPTRVMMHSKKIDSWILSHMSFWLDGYRRVYMDFRQELQDKKIEKNYDYIKDLTALFDDKPEVYMDAAHVFESGNQIISETILKVIRRRVSLFS